MKLKILYFSLLTFCSLNAQVISNSDFETMDLGVMGNAGAGLPDWFAQTNTNAVGDCGDETGNLPINDDIRVIDFNGNKAVAFYANGKRCNNNSGAVVDNAAIIGQKLINLVVGQTYDVSLDASYDGETLTSGVNFQIRPTAAYNYGGRVGWFNTADPKAAYVPKDGIVPDYTTFSYQFTVPEGTDLSVDHFLVVVKGAGGIPNDTDHIIVDNVTVAEGLSNKDFSKFQFSLFPNPATSQLNLNANTSIDDVVVSNTLGQKVKQLHFGTREAFINVSDLNKGIYIITAKIDGQSGTYRFIKK